MAVTDDNESEKENLYKSARIRIQPRRSYNKPLPAQEQCVAVAAAMRSNGMQCIIMLDRTATSIQVLVRHGFNVTGAGRCIGCGSPIKKTTSSSDVSSPSV